MKKIILDINKEGNPKYFTILDEFNSISSEYKRINTLLLDHRVPKFYLLGQEEILATLGKQVKNLHERFLEWDGVAFNFLIHPEFSFPEITDSNTNFLHYMSIIRDVRMEGHNSFQGMIRNWDTLYNSYSAQLNFIIAISSFVLTMLGLIVSLVGTFISIVGTIVSIVGIIIAILTLG